MVFCRGESGAGIQGYSPEGNPASDILYLLEQNWSRFVSSFILTERLKNRARRVDGLIIGTGESDFTKGNTHYDLCIDDKVFRLIDVPGIEGNENCYADWLRSCCASAPGGLCQRY